MVENDNIIPFPSPRKNVVNYPIANLNRDIDIILDMSKDIEERSSALLRWAEELLKPEKE